MDIRECKFKIGDHVVTKDFCSGGKITTIYSTGPTREIWVFYEPDTSFRKDGQDYAVVSFSGELVPLSAHEDHLILDPRYHRTDKLNQLGIV